MLYELRLYRKGTSETMIHELVDTVRYEAKVDQAAVNAAPIFVAGHEADYAVLLDAQHNILWIKKIDSHAR